MIVNENDTVSTDEIKVGDNDTLAASIATTIQADLFVILTDQKGLFTENPTSSSQADLIRSVDVDDDILSRWPPNPIQSLVQGDGDQNQGSKNRCEIRN